MNGYARRSARYEESIDVVALLALTSAHAQWIDKQGNRLADTDDRKAIGRFGA